MGAMVVRLAVAKQCAQSIIMHRATLSVWLSASCALDSGQFCSAYEIPGFCLAQVISCRC